MHFIEKRQTKSVSNRWKQPKGEDTGNVKKEATLLRCTLPKWISVEHTEYMRRYKRKREIFLGLNTD